MSQTKSLYLNKTQLQAELERCLNCKKAPCLSACPVNCNPQEFINFAKQKNYADSVKAITRNNPLGQTCGLICPDKFCMQACTRSHIDFAINIPKVQATILENFRSENSGQECHLPNHHQIAVIGAGPAGISAASELAKLGYQVSIFEATNQIGGALNLIPSTRLPHEVIEKDWNFITDCGRVELNLNSQKNPDDLVENGFDGVIVASGEPNCMGLHIKGEEYCLTFMEYLSNPEKYQTSGQVAIIGGGNVAADCAFTARDNGSVHVEMFVRRKLSDMKITRNECLELLHKQIDITTMTSLEKVAMKKGLISLYTCKNHFVDEKLQPLPNSTIERPGFSLVIKAIGSYADYKSDAEKIIYAGDCKHGGSTVVEAIASGQAAALNLHERLKV